jgi:hypothetical protein
MHVVFVVNFSPDNQTKTSKTKPEATTGWLEKPAFSARNNIFIPAGAEWDAGTKQKRNLLSRQILNWSKHVSMQSCRSKLKS